MEYFRNNFAITSNELYGEPKTPHDSKENLRRGCDVRHASYCKAANISKA